MTTVLAHGNGLDEAIFVMVPLVILVVLLRLGARKAPPEDEPPDDQQST
jgi:hypothetical protein